MNKFSKYLQKFKEFPSLINYIIRFKIPYTGTSNLKFEKISNNETIVSLKNSRKVQNHIGQIHAVGMILLAESATGILVGTNVKDQCLPLCKSLNSKFIKRSKGSMKAIATLTDEQINYIQNSDKGETSVQVKITDETNNEPIICEVIWAWIPKNKI